MDMRKIKVILIAIILIGLVVGYYMYLSHRTEEQKESQKTEQTTEEDSSDGTKERDGDEGYEQEISNLITKDLEKQYPATPAAVLKFFGRIQVCYYNSGCPEEKIEKLADQARMLFSKELLEDNPRESYLTNLKGEIQRYKEKEITIVNYSVQDPEKIEKKTIDGIEYAEAEVTYYLQTKGAYSEIKEIYVLKQNDDENWKIVGWTNVNEDETDGNE